jgi:hypothetical protein
MLDALEVWHNHQNKVRNDQGPKPTAADTLFRCSDAGSCLRKRAFSALKMEETEAIGASTLLAFEIGNSIHDSIQEAFMADFGFECEVETAIDLTPHGVSLSGHTDGIITMPDGTKIILEIKTMSGFAAKLHFNGDPKREHVAQAGMYALGVNADAILLVYVAKEGDFRAGIKPGMVQQWYFEMDQEALPYETVREIATAELDRFKMVEDALYAKVFPAALVPNDAGDLVLVDDPPDYGSKGKPWNCAYCQHNSLCRSLGSEETPLTLGGVQ